MRRLAFPPLRRALDGLVTGRRGLPGFAQSRSGAAAVEFALLLPLMILVIYFGVVAVSMLVITDRKMALVSRSLADLTARSPTGVMAGTELGNIFAASTAIMYPYADATLQMVVSSVRVTKTNNVASAKVIWSCGRNMTVKPANADTNWSLSNLQPRDKDSAVSIPAGFESSPSFILVETRIIHTPIVGAGVIGTRIINENTVWPARNVSEITYSGACPVNPA